MTAQKRKEKSERDGSKSYFKVNSEVFEYDVSSQKRKKSEPKQVIRPVSVEKYFKQTIVTMIEMEIANHVSHHNHTYLDEIERQAMNR